MAKLRSSLFSLINGRINNLCTVCEKSSSGILKEKSASFGLVILQLDVKELTHRPTLIPLFMSQSSITAYKHQKQFGLTLIS